MSRWLSSVLTVARHETRLLVHAPITLIFQVWFLLALSMAVFLVADFYATDLASLDLQWTFLPWVTVILAPALAMRAFSEGPGDRSLEMVLALPLAPGAVVAGKWLAGTAILLITLSMTAPFAATVGFLGTPDWGTVCSGYIGAALFLSVVYAIALAGAALTRDQVTAYVTGLGLLISLLLLGWDTATRALSGVLPGTSLASMVVLSPKHWLDRMAEGRIEVAAVAYCTVVIAVALAAAHVCFEQRRTPTGPKAGRARVVSLGVMTAMLAGLLTIAISHIPGQIDLTAEGRFTLHPATRAIARDAAQGTSIDYYYSRDDSRVPAAIRLHARRVVRMLEDLVALSGGRIRLNQHFVAEDEDAEATALAAGVRRIPMTSGDHFMLGAVLRRADREGVIPYFDETRAGLLEYDLALAVETLSRKRTPKVGILSPLLRASTTQAGRAGLAIVEDLKRNFDVAIIPHFDDSLPEGLDALIVIDAPILKRDMLRAIDDHVAAGRGLIALLDPYPRFNRANAQAAPSPGDDINDISDLLAHYGARYRGGNVIGDPGLAALVAGQDGRRLAYPYWLRVPKASLAAGHPVTASLNELLFAEAGSFEVATGKLAVPLVQTTPDAGTSPRGEIKPGASEALAAAFKSDGQGQRTIAAVLTGPFERAFPETPTTGQEKTGDLASPGADTSSPATVFAVADADWLFDPMALQTVSVGEATITRPLNDNAAFLLNMAEYATGSRRLAAIRSRGKLRRPFARVARMLRASAERYRTEEAQYVTRIDKVEGSIAKVLESTGAKSVDQLPDQLAAEIRELRGKLLPFRRELRQIRRKMREDVESLGTRLTLFNLLAGPLLAFAFAGANWYFRRRRRLDSRVT